MKWTVYSEEKPQKVGSYLVTHTTISGSNYVDYDYWTVTDKFKYHPTDVVAWMPFPKPYVAEQTEPQTYTINPKEPTNMPKCFDCEDFFTCYGQCDKVECEKCKHFREEAEMYTHQCEFYFMECKFEPKTEPQTDCPWK